MGWAPNRTHHPRDPSGGRTYRINTLFPQRPTLPSISPGDSSSALSTCYAWGPGLATDRDTFPIKGSRSLSLSDPDQWSGDARASGTMNRAGNESAKPQPPPSLID